MLLIWVLAADASGISKIYLFSLRVMSACMVDKARDKPDLVWSTLHNSITKNIKLFLN